MKNILQSLFSSLFIFWIILGVLELVMPGFAIYYINLNWLLLTVIVMGFVNLLILADKK